LEPVLFSETKAYRIQELLSYVIRLLFSSNW